MSHDSLFGMPRLTFPAALASLLIIGITCAKYGEYRTAERQRRFERMAAHGDSVTQGFVAHRDSELAERRAAIAPACPAREGATDISSWGTTSISDFPVTVATVPDFGVDYTHRPQGAGYIGLAGSHGDRYQVTYSDHEDRVQNWPQYELAAECADVADVLPGMIQTARDTSQDGMVKVVIASYRLPNGRYVNFLGTTRDVARQAQFVTAAHSTRLNR